jgi:hypothetical protein
MLLALSCAAPRAGEPSPSTPHALPAGDVSEPGPAAPVVAPAVERGVTRPVTASERRAIETLMHQAERVRELRFERTVDVIVQDAAAIEAYVESQIEPKHVDEALALYGALGLIDPKSDLRALWLRLMSEQVVGYYDIDHGRLVIRDDVMRAFEHAGGSARVKKRSFAERSQPKTEAKTHAKIDLEEARVVLIHELVHALQDQHLSLAQIMKDDRDTDGENALRALVEGDATLAMISYVFDKEGVPLSALTRDPARVRGLSEAVTAPMQGTELASAPPIVRVSLLSAYVDGLNFAAALHGAGGFARLNRAYAELPVSSEQILHPERFVRHEPVQHVSLPQAADLLGDQHTLIVQDTLGELEMTVYFGQAKSADQARRAADGWSGDRVYVFRAPKDQLAAVWITTWDSERHAIEAESAAQAVRQAAPPDARERQTVLRTGQAVLIARGLGAEQLETVRSRFSAWFGRDKRDLAGEANEPGRVPERSAKAAAPLQAD